jgi:hypothetical protein
VRESSDDVYATSAWALRAQSGTQVLGSGWAQAGKDVGRAVPAHLPFGRSGTIATNCR